MNNNTNDIGLKTLVGRTISFEALHNIFIRANKIHADISELNVTNSISGKLIKQRIDEINPKIYMSGSNPKIDESDMIKGIVVFTEKQNSYLNSNPEKIHETQLSLLKTNVDNPYTINNGIGYLFENKTSSTIDHYETYKNTNDIILNIDLPPKLLLLNVGDSIDFTIINQGTHSLMMNDTCDYKIIGFQLIYDGTSAQFKVHKVSENTYNIYRLT